MVTDTQVQVGQILSDMSRNHVERPLLWCYNWMLAGPLALVPAVARLVHATEAHFDMPGYDPYIRRLGAAIVISDLTVAVSEGVANGIRTRVEGAEVVTVANGCDYRRYSAGKPDASLIASGRPYRRTAVYAGNINGRLDFDLLHALAAEHPDVLLAFYGRVSSLSESDAAAWQKLLTLGNVKAFGEVDPDRLPDIYAAADVGLIPYRQYPLLVENGLPLKALEMCATGLPVVSSLMRPLEGMASGLVVTSTDDQFRAAFEKTSRASLSVAQLKELHAVSSANDYDHKFQEIVGALDANVTDPRPATRADRLIDAMGEEWVAAEVWASRWAARPAPLRFLGGLLSTGARLIPGPLKRRQVYERLRRAGRALSRS